MKAQRKAENKMALTVVQLKQTKKQLETKEAEISQVEQAAYDMGMTKATKSLAAQLRDVTWAFCLEVWGQALNATVVSTELKLRAPDKPALRLVPTPLKPSADPSFAPLSSSNQPASTLSTAPTKDKEQE